MRTLIELFDNTQIENVVAALRMQPETIVFVGFEEIMTRKKVDELERFWKVHQFPGNIIYQPVERYDLDAIIQTLHQLADTYDDCCFDLTGGKELVLVAMGMVAATRKMPMIQFNVRTGELIRVRNSDHILETGRKFLTIKESVVLNGGALVETVDDFAWKLTDDFQNDIDHMWKICSQNSSRWNQQTKKMGGLEQYKLQPEDLHISVVVKNAEKHTLPDPEFFEALADKNLILDYHYDEEKLMFRYKNEQVRRSIIKSGNILELYAYSAAKEITEKDPGYYDDIQVGVSVDWDGVLHDENFAVKETRNEIDLILMRDMIPVFVSCKNGEVHKDALYELEAVAQRYGGKYAKKVLLATYLNSGGTSRKYLLERARDMRIQVIEGIDRMKREEFLSILKKRTR